jgi:hypothetical protein
MVNDRELNLYVCRSIYIAGSIIEHWRQRRESRSRSNSIARRGMASGGPFQTPAQCIARAVECERRAKTAIGAENKALFLELAQRWRKQETYTPIGHRKVSPQPSHC